MFAGLFSSTKNTTKTILLVDIGSGSVGAGLAKLDSNGKPTLLYTKREDLPISLTRSGEELQNSVLTAVGVVIEDVRKVSALWSEGTTSLPQKIEHIAFFLAAPWSITTLRSIHFSRTKPFKMTLSVLERMLAEESKSAAGPESGMNLEIERTAVSLRLNEYKAESLSNSMVTTVDVTLATTNSFASLRDALFDFARLFEGSAISFHSFGLPASYALQVLRPDISDALLLDVGAEVTEILHLKQGALVGRATAPVGSNLFMRTLKTHADMSTAQSNTALTLAKAEGTRFAEELTGPLADAGRVWLRGVSTALLPLAENGLPIEIYVLSDARVLSWVYSSLESVGMPEIYRGALPKIMTLSGKEFENVLNLKPGTADIFLMAELLFADSRFDAGHSLSLLSTRDPLLARHHATIG